MCFLSFHHLIPIKVHRSAGPEELFQEDLQQVDLCGLCHRGIHRLFEQTTLAGIRQP